MTNSSNKPTLHLIDGSGYIFRAYHALPPLSTSKGVPTGAVRGVASMLLKDLREQKPTHLAVCFDLDGKVYRSELYPEYKAHRPPAPEDLVPQFGLVRDVVRALDLPLLEVEGFEADDIIATLTKKAVAEGFRVVVVSGDKDLMQLVCEDQCSFYDGMRNEWFGPEEVKAKWGVGPSLVGDLLALMGDTSDNIPGVKGVGPKTATALLEQFGSLEELLQRTDEIARPKLRQAIVENVEQIRLARQLVQLHEAVPLEVELEDLKLGSSFSPKARELFSELEMFTLLKGLPVEDSDEESGTAAQQEELATEIISSEAALDALANKLEESERFALDVVLSGTRPLVDSLMGIAFSVGDTSAYVPVGAGSLSTPALSEKKVLSRLKAALEADTPKKDGHGLKTVVTALLKRGVKLGGLGVDVEVASFLLNAARREHTLESLARERLGLNLPHPPLDSKKRPALAQGLPEELAPYSGARAFAARRLAPLLIAELESEGLSSLYLDVELPVLPILSSMEVLGIRVDAENLREQSAGFEEEIVQRTAEIHALAGREFNVNAPAQLATVLFEDLQLPVLKKGKTGPSTNAEVLEKLAESHPLPRKILEYRSIAKLKNTYLDTLPELIAEDGRIHSTFNQFGAATGRLSSDSPNLQNIPIRSEHGRRIREAFVADPGCVLVSADYSQIELRILAHMSQDPALVESFTKGEDVHRRTAAEIYGVSQDLVEREMREVAKMINYAIAYGLSPYGLSSRLEIPTGEAKAIIDRYFERYAGVKTWLDQTVEDARKVGLVTTILGRRRQLPELVARNPNVRMGAERAAVNSPIQGTAADIVKKAMVLVDQALKNSLPEARMLLQVHDELVFEVKKEQRDVLIELVRPIMESALPLSVPLLVEIGSGDNWAVAH